MDITFDGFFFGFWCGAAAAFALAWWVEWRDRPQVPEILKRHFYEDEE
jgi:hypothetical protein